MKTINPFILSLIFVISFPFIVDAQKYKPTSKQTFYGNNSTWNSYTKSTFKYYNQGIDSAVELVEVWNANSQTWDKSSTDIGTYLNDGRLKYHLVSSFIPNLNDYLQHAKTEVTYNGYIINGSVVSKEAKRSISGWDDNISDWKEEITYENTYTGPNANLKETIGKQGFFGPLQDNTKREYIYTNGQIGTTKFSIKMGGHWVNRTIMFTNYNFGTDLINKEDEYDYTDGNVGNAIGRATYTYTSFNEFDSIKSFTYDTTSMSYNLVWYKVFEYNGVNNLLSETSYNVSNGVTSKDAKIEYSYEMVSVNQPELKTSKIYPNPASNLVWVESNDPIKSVIITDFQGKSILNFETTHVSKGIDVSSLIRGTYILQIEYMDGVIGREKLVLK